MSTRYPTITRQFPNAERGNAAYVRKLLRERGWFDPVQDRAALAVTVGARTWRHAVTAAWADAFSPAEVTLWMLQSQNRRS
jgi:hypothetical protein